MSDPRCSTPTTGRLFALCCAMGSAAIGSCVDLLGIEAGEAGAVICGSNDDCAPDYRCDEFQCRSRRCSEGATQCRPVGRVVRSERCNDRLTWERVQTCDAMCRDGECRTPKSCARTNPMCAGASCCSSSVVSGGTYSLEYRYSSSEDESRRSVPRTVRTFMLDRFEVTWSRFVEFKYAYGQGEALPADGAGAHPASPASGWKQAWNDARELVPDSARALTNVLNRNGQQTMDELEGSELPMRGLNWYLAFAFCIWDGGRLPTEAEWALAAAGRDQTRIYPWDNADLGDDITHDHAVYSDSDLQMHGPANVGTHPAGRSAAGQDDLAGNLAEWTADVYQERLDDSCEEESARALDEHECVQRNGGATHVVRGGSFADDPARLRNVARSYASPASENAWIGFRCARNLTVP